MTRALRVIRHNGWRAVLATVLVRVPLALPLLGLVKIGEWANRQGDALSAIAPGLDDPDA